MALEITADTAVRQIIKTYPACAEVFMKYGMGNCDHGHGPEGPEKPIWYFCKNHGVELEQLIKELKEKI
jgi:hypothetical protein